MKSTIRTYTQLQKIDSFIDRFNYLRLDGLIGESTFGYDRYMNQLLYSSKRWRQCRDGIIIRDNGCDLGMEDYEIKHRITIHHMNPITIEDIELERDIIFDPEFLISTSFKTHGAIHYSDESLLPKIYVDRKPNDTCPWR